MRRLFCLLAVAFGLFGLSVLSPIGATAAPADDAIAALRDSPLYVDPSAGALIDQSAVLQAIGDQPLLIAVLPASVGDPFDQARAIGVALPGRTVGVVAGRDFRAGSDIVCAGFADDAAGAAVDVNTTQLQADGDLTALLVDFAGRMRGAPGLSSCPSSSAATDTGGGNGWIWFAGIGVVGLVGGGAYVVSRRRRQARDFEGRRAEILSHYNRLGADVSALDPGDDPITRQAVADASERYTSTGALLADADTTGEYDAARRTVLEGLAAARTARQRMGLDLGPELPPVEVPRGEQLTEKRAVTVDGKTYEGHPGYTPGSPYYYAGGAGVPGGWYAFPFWETLLLGSVLSGGLGGGGLFGGGGFERGYDSGYGSGYDQGQDAAGGGFTGGGDWGHGGGGDWGGGGGGDWGGGGGSDGGANSW